MLRIRAEARTRPLRREVVAQLEVSRGYRDIDPDDCWGDWQRRRESLLNPPQSEECESSDDGPPSHDSQAAGPAGP